jgi:hypothetical protein
MKLETKIIASLDEHGDDHWEVEVTIDEGQRNIVVNVKMNPDTVLCSYPGMSFKTYAWKGHSVEGNAARAAIDYITQ